MHERCLIRVPVSAVWVTATLQQHSDSSGLARGGSRGEWTACGDRGGSLELSTSSIKDTISLGVQQELQGRDVAFSGSQDKRSGSLL
jgi:hypothetical protein